MQILDADRSERKLPGCFADRVMKQALSLLTRGRIAIVGCGASPSKPSN
jgi:hypothetical protein